MPSCSVGIIGVGNMGGAMARNLLRCGWTVQVCDLDAAKTLDLERFGARVHASGSKLAMDSEVIIVAVVDGGQTREALFGPQGAACTLRPGQTVMLCPTVSPQDVEEIAARLAERGVHTVDAPMSGGPQRAALGTMSLMVACPTALFETHRTLIEALADPVFRISERPGDGARTKLVNNLLAAINLVGAAEALALAQHLGLDAASTLAVIERSSGQSWIGSDRLRRALAQDWAPRAHVTLLEKDTRLALQAACAVGFDGPLGAAASAVFRQAVNAGLGDEDDAALFKLLAGGGA